MAMKNNKTPLPASADGFFGFLLSAVCMVLTLAVAVIHKFIYPLGKDLLSPALMQTLVLLIPACLCLCLLSSSKGLFGKLRDLGFGKLHAEYVFFMIYGAMFAITTSTLLDLLFGAKHAAEGFALLGLFTAGADEYTVAAPYLILIYAILPAIIEEVAFRGVLFGSLRPLGYAFSVCMSAILASLFVFSPAGFVTALFCNLTYCFIRHTTGVLQSCIPVHFAVNLFSLYFGTNICRYFISSQNTTLLIIILITAWLISCILFFGESARLYKKSAEAIHEGKEKSRLPAFLPNSLLQKAKAILSHKPTLICACLTLACYIGVVVINILK